MSLGDVLGAVGLLAAIIGIAVAVFYGRKALTADRHKLTWHFQSTPLISARAGAYRSAIDVRLGDVHIYDPHLVRLEVTNTGKRDIDSSRFDQARPLIFELSKVKVSYLIEAGSPVIKADDRSIRVGPELLRRGESWVVTMIADGPARVELADDRLIDVEVIQAHDSEGEPADRWAKMSTIVAGLSLIVAILSLFQFTK